jgi:ankyrin repeat protein
MDIITATKENNLKKVIELIKKNININLTNKDGDTALMWASYYGYINIIKELIKAGANVNLQNKFGCTALIWASEKGYLEIVKKLIKANDVRIYKLGTEFLETRTTSTNVNLRNIYGDTALIWASNNGYLDIVEELIKANADVNLQSNYGNTASALICAIKKNNIKIVKALIKAGANLNLQYKNGGTALIWASYDGHIEIVIELIKANVNIDYKFIKYIKKYNIDILKLLINKNFNIGLEYGASKGTI